MIEGRINVPGFPDDFFCCLFVMNFPFKKFFFFLTIKMLPLRKNSGNLLSCSEWFDCDFMHVLLSKTTVILKSKKFICFNRNLKYSQVNDKLKKIFLKKTIGFIITMKIKFQGIGGNLFKEFVFDCTCLINALAASLDSLLGFPYFSHPQIY
jgi:hypothetical protein